MNCATFCRHLLKVTRKEAPAVPRIVAVHASRTTPRDELYAYVDFDGVDESVEVSACCRYAARAKAIDIMVERREREAKGAQVVT